MKENVKLKLSHELKIMAKEYKEDFLDMIDDGQRWRENKESLTYITNEALREAFKDMQFIRILI